MVWPKPSTLFYLSHPSLCRFSSPSGPFQASHGSVHSLKETADHISDTERNSADAERDSKDVKLFAYLKAQLQSENPQPYPALLLTSGTLGSSWMCRARE